MSSKISNSYDAIIVGCGIAGSVVGAILPNMEHVTCKDYLQLLLPVFR
jgi:RAB protein geranylgeranyltransferase component A